MIRRPPRSTRVRSSAASDVYKRQVSHREAVVVVQQSAPIKISQPVTVFQIIDLENSCAVVGLVESGGRFERVVELILWSNVFRQCSLRLTQRGEAASAAASGDNVGAAASQLDPLVR